MAKAFYNQEGMSLTRVHEDPEETSATATLIVDDATCENATIVVQGACNQLTIAEVEVATDDIKNADIFLTQHELPLPPTIRGIEIAHAFSL
jgi:sugar/nucleoside kinase (ribokinase family)